MIRLWRKLIQPVLQAVDAKSIMEIGAEFGTSTNVLLNYVKENNGHLYCIDPVPEFDADEFQKSNKGAVTFYRDLSLNVLSGHPQYDVAMVDGDHNWYTVYNELKQIEESHQHDAMHQPLIFIHDICWPYGRRDLYYNPATIPQEYLQPYEQKGILLNRSELSENSGINKELCNASHEGGARNGVLTGVEDYLAESELEYEFIKVPIYFGLGILITKQRLQSNEALQKVINNLQSIEGERAIVELAEHLRCVDISFAQAVNRQLQESQLHVEELKKKLQALQGGGALE